MKLAFIRFCVITFLIPSIFLSAGINEVHYMQSIKGDLSKIPGWCSSQKADSIMNLIFETRPNVCVELGVFAGASLFPTAMALKYLNHGIVYGIDAWNTAEAIQYYQEGSPNKIWWQNLDMATYYSYCENLLKKHRLKNHCILLKSTFANAISKIDSIDILHIDGTHTSAGDFIDALPYCLKVRNGGYIWFDGWADSPQLYEYLQAQFEVKKVINSGNCILLQRISI